MASFKSGGGTSGPPSGPASMTYQNFLRAIGRHLDRGRYRYSLICQVPTGFVIRGYPNGFENVRSAEALEFTVDDLTALVADLMVTRSPLPASEIPDSSQVPRLLPTGYEDFLRALGFECDNTGMRSVRLVETLEGILLSYNLDGSKVRQERMFDEQQIYALLNTAFGRRRPGQRLPIPPPTAAPVPPVPPVPAAQEGLRGSPLRRINK